MHLAKVELVSFSLITSSRAKAPDHVDGEEK